MSDAKKHDRKIKLKDIEFNENKFRKLFAAQEKKRRYYDHYSDNNDNESADGEYEGGIEVNDKDEKIIVKKKNKKRKEKKKHKRKNITKTKLPPLKKQKKK